MSGRKVEAASVVYVALLRSPDRHLVQAELCEARDFIAKATGRSAEDVQNEHEDIANYADTLKDRAKEDRA